MQKQSKIEQFKQSLKYSSTRSPNKSKPAEGKENINPNISTFKIGDLMFERKPKKKR